MISSCLPFLCLTHRNKVLYRRPRRTYRHHRESVYDIPDFAALPLAAPFFIPPSPPPPEPDLPLPLIPLPRPEEPLEPLPLVHYRPRSPPLVPVQPRQVHHPEIFPYPEPIVYREPLPYPEPILYPQLIPYREPPADCVHLHLCLPRMVGLYGNYIRPEELRAAVEVALDMILRELREPDYYRDRGLRLGGFRGIGSLSDDRRLGDVELEEYIRRMNLVVQIANSHVTTRMMHAEIHPKISDSGADAGRYPREFERPRRLEEFFVMDSSTLDRILQSYGLPRDGYSRDNLSLNLGRSTLSGLSLGRPLGLNDRLNDTDRVRDQKLRNLFEFLGVDMRDGLGSFGAGLGGRDLLGAGRLGNRGGPGLLRALDRY